MRLGYSIKSIREARAMSAAELAAKSGVTPAYLSLIESGQRVPSADVLRRISVGLKVDFDMLYSLLTDEAAPGLSNRRKQVIDALQRLREAQQLLKQQLG